MEKERFKFISTSTSPSMEYDWTTKDIDPVTVHTYNKHEDDGKENERADGYGYRLSVFVLSCLSSAQKCVHAMNSVVEYMKSFHGTNEYLAWMRDGHKFIMREIDNEEIFSLIIETMEKNGITYAGYKEKSLNCLLTSIAVIVDERAYRNSRCPICDIPGNGNRKEGENGKNVGSYCLTILPESNGGMPAHDSIIGMDSNRMMMELLDSTREITFS